MKSIIISLIALVTLSQYDSESCSEELAAANVTSSSAINKVWVTFNNIDTNQTFQVQNITEGNSKTIPSLPSGKYNVNAMGYFDVGVRNVSVSLDVKQCIDYNVFVDSFSSTSFRISITGKAR